MAAFAALPGRQVRAFDSGSCVSPVDSRCIVVRKEKKKPITCLQGEKDGNSFSPCKLLGMVGIQIKENGFKGGLPDFSGRYEYEKLISLYMYDYAM